MIETKDNENPKRMNARGIPAWLMILSMLLVSPAVRGAVAEGENLLINGTLDAEQVDFPEFWSPSSDREVFHRPAGGPGGKLPSVLLKGDGAGPGTASLRQQGINLVAGETYKLSAWIRTKGYRSHSGGVIIHNRGWIAATGITKLAADSEWTRYEKTFPMMASENREYGLAVYAVDLAGELEVADLKLEAVSEKARQGSTSQASLVAAPRLVPVHPLLNHIPKARPELTLKFFGILPEPKDAYDCVVTATGDPAPGRPVALSKDGSVRINLAGVACGDLQLKAAVRHRKSKQIILETTYPASVVDLPEIDRSRVRPLNNLVAELLSQPVSGQSEPQTFTFVQPRDGWVFVALTGAGTPAPDLAVSLDGREPAIVAGTNRLEAFRELPMGEHVVEVRGSRAAARLVVRSIPEIFNYPPCASSQVTENGSYGWEFMKAHILPAVTTLNGGILPGEALGEAKGLGLKWLANFNVKQDGDAEELRQRMEKTRGMIESQYDGFTSDELFFGRPAGLSSYTEALRALPNPGNRLVYTWIVGKPGIASLDTDFMSVALNAARGRGRLLFEAYCHPQADEAAAAAYLDGMLGETMRRFSAFYPDAATGTGMIFGNFNQIPIISLEHDPAVDFKVFLDLQVNRVANGPEFKDLATVGYWGTYYGDEELVRWSFQLMRHYAVEGNRDRLSDHFGYRYNPGHLTNPDFAEGLKGWTVTQAAEGSVRADRMRGYGKAQQGRWGAGGAGDTVCVMVRQAALPNRIFQVAQGLQPGKVYSLQFVTADRKDVVAKKYNPRRYGIRASLEGAAMVSGKSFVHVDRRKAGADGKESNVGKINLNRVIFRAGAATQKIEFSDEEGLPGEELMLNFVQLKPYFE